MAINFFKRDKKNTLIFINLLLGIDSTMAIATEQVLVREGENPVKATSGIVRATDFFSFSPRANSSVHISNGTTVDLGSTYNIVTTATDDDGLFATGANSTITADSINIVTSGLRGDGMAASNGGAIIVGTTTGSAGVNIVTSGAQANGLYALNNGSIKVGAGTTLTTNGTNAHGLVANGMSGTPGIIEFQGDVNNRNKITVNSNSIGVQVIGTGAVAKVANTDIVVSGLSTSSTSGILHGIWASNNGHAEMTNVSISVPDEGTAVFATTNANILFNGDTTIKAGGVSSTGIFSSNASITLNGKTDITGSMLAGNGGSLIINSSKDSVINGTTALAGNSTLNLTMTQGVWNIPGTSSMSNLTLNDSTVNFVNNTNGFKTLTTNSLSGNGIFNMNTDIVGQQSDLLVINGTATGTHQVKVTNNGAATTDGTERQTVIQATDNQANYSLVNKVELGAYEYDLRKSPDDINAVELFGSPKNNGSGNGSGSLTTTAQAAGSFLNIGYLTNYIENQTLLQRLGDLRTNSELGIKSDGFWLKGFGGKLNSFSGTALDRFDMTYTGTQFGIDKSFDVSSGNLLVGAMAGFTRTNPNYRRGNGNGKNYTVGLYTTYFLENGLYIDTTLKYNSMRNHFNVKDTAGSAVKGTGKTQGVTLSAEIGKRFWLTDNRQGFYVEPQAQLSYGYQNGDSVHSSNGLKVGLSHYNSTLGRVSGIIGYQIQGENPINIYLKTGFVREMSGGASYRFNDGVKNGHSFRSNWFDNGLGINININKKHTIYAEADYATGNHFDNAKLDIGYRYSF